MDTLRSQDSAKLNQPLTNALLFLASVVFFYALATFATLLSNEEGRVAAIWPASALAFVLFLKLGKPAKWSALAGFVAGILFSNLHIGDGLVRAAMLALADMAEVLVMARVYEFVRRPRFVSFTGVLKLLFAALIACLVSTAIAAMSLALTGMRLPASEAAVWFAAHLLGIILFVPPLWTLSIRSARFRLSAVDLRFVGEFLFVCTVTLGVFFQSEYPLLFLVPPVLAILAYSKGVKAASWGLLAVTFIAIPCTLMGRGPTALMYSDMIPRVLVLQLFLVTNSILALAIGAIVSDRNRLIRQLKRSTNILEDRARTNRELIRKAHLAEQMSGVGHWSLDPATSAVYWSPQVYKIHGVTPDSFDPNYGDAVAFYSDDDRPMIEGLVERAIERGEGWEFEATLITAMGDPRRVRSIGECLKDKAGNVEQIIGVFKDITEENRVYEELAEREQQYRLLAEHATDIVLKFNLDGEITFVSPSCEILGISPEEAIGISALQFVLPEDREAATQAVRDLVSGRISERNARSEHRAPSAKGGYLWLESSPTLVRDEEGRPTAIISTYRDVTDRREREDALAAARLEAEAATQAKTEFLSNMSHEIRTPLNGILGFTKLVSQTELTEEQRDYLANIRRAGTMLREIVDDILDFSKVEAGRIELDNQPFDLHEAVEDTVSLVKAARTDSSVEIVHTPDAEGPLCVVADETRLRQILTNLVGNAAKFTEEGRIDIRTQIVGETISIKVEDTGRGIPADKLEHVFEGFRQADSTITRRYGGSGLGLSISRSLAHLMGGDLSLESVLGEGTTVTLTLPYQPAEGGIQKDHSSSPEESGISRAGHILVIDDVEMNLSLIRHGLKHSSYDVTTYTSATAAIEALRAGTQFDLIFMDVQMPDMDGLTATRLIRQMPEPISSVPIVAMTAQALPSQIRECLDAGMDEHFAKPVDLDKMKILIGRLLSVSQQDPSSASDFDDVMAELQAEYKVYLASLKEEFGAILETGSARDAVQSIRALAHAVAGTAGSYGFDEVSRAAFDLEARAVELSEHSTPDLKALNRKVQELVETSQKALAA